MTEEIKVGTRDDKQGVGYFLNLKVNTFQKASSVIIRLNFEVPTFRSVKVIGISQIFAPSLWAR